MPEHMNETWIPLKCVSHLWRSFTDSLEHEDKQKMVSQPSGGIAKRLEELKIAVRFNKIQWYH